MMLADLKAYNRLVHLALKIHFLTLEFSAIERYELGSQLRRSLDSAPANVAECFGNKHISTYNYPDVHG